MLSELLLLVDLILGSVSSELAPSEAAVSHKFVST